jgi:hypothetical protein
VPRQVGAHGFRVGPPTRRQDAVEIASTWRQGIGLGMAHQQQKAHEFSAFFRTIIAASTLNNDAKIMKITIRR